MCIVEYSHNHPVQALIFIPQPKLPTPGRLLQPPLQVPSSVLAATWTSTRRPPPPPAPGCRPCPLRRRLRPSAQPRPFPLDPTLHWVRKTTLYFKPWCVTVDLIFLPWCCHNTIDLKKKNKQNLSKSNWALFTNRKLQHLNKWSETLKASTQFAPCSVWFVLKRSDKL